MKRINFLKINSLKSIVLGVIIISFAQVCFAAKAPTPKPLNTSDFSSAKIKNIEFEGNQLINTSDIVKSMQMQVGDSYSKEMVQQNLKSIYNMGYFSEKMKAIPIPEDSDNVTLRIYLEENTPITGFTVDGNTVIPTGEVLEQLSSLENQPQNLNTLNSAIANIEELYASKGYILARVVDVKDDPDGVVNITISEGKINTIKFEGNKKTKDFVIQRNILSTTGSIYNDNTVRADLMRLYGTQAFKDVNRTIEKCDEQGLYDITINLEEQRTGTVSLGGGVDTATGLFGQVGYAENNFRGLGQRLAVNFMSGTGVILSDSSMLRRANLQAEVSWFEPRLKGSDTSLLVKAFGRDFSSYQVPLSIEQRYGAEVVFSRPLKGYKNLSASFKLGVEHINMKEGDFGQISSLYAQHNIPITDRAKQLQGGTFITLGPSLIYDTRDNILNPRDGVFATLRFNENVSFTDFKTTHGTLTASIKKYFPVMNKSAFSLMARAGGKIHGDNMPEVMAFRLGGPYSVRGYKMSGIGTGDGFVMASAELTTPFFFLDRIKKAPFLDNIKFATFVDAGQIYNGTITNKLYNRPENGIAAGVGLRVFIPGVGPLSIDYGMPFTNVGAGNSKGAFTFGVGDYY